MQVIQREPWEHIKDEDIKKTAASFSGEIWQVPPMFSAIKRYYGEVTDVMSSIGYGRGEKMYDKARRGETVELSPRQISIFQFDIERSLNNRYVLETANSFVFISFSCIAKNKCNGQNLIFRVSCSKGTYIRSLCADFGKALGSCAHLTALRRDSIGKAFPLYQMFGEIEYLFTEIFFYYSNYNTLLLILMFTPFSCMQIMWNCFKAFLSKTKLRK
ncbi:hypothetical protein IFM89_027315 [Coptis chinensis]|uniref:tRNA pseudouridine(55) synthase n=1 Tax=Coptis chinensis TaxID=261450 RepID=A0A835HXK4_9MAGN|nr:hypothetical protein IFM89_027315 [Coptis chinensis]